MWQKKAVILVILINSLILSSSFLWALPQVGLPNAEYFALVQQKIGGFLFYPQEARLKGWEGVVALKLTIARNGDLKALDIAKSSGYPLIDEAAMSAVRNASPYPSLENYLEAEELEIVIPLNYAGLIEAPVPEKKITPAEKAQPIPKEISLPYLDLVRKAAQPDLVEKFIYESGIRHYQAGRYEEALAEFKKALIINPASQTAWDYIDRIRLRQEGIPVPGELAQPIPEEIHLPHLGKKPPTPGILEGMEEELIEAIKERKEIALTRLDKEPTVPKPEDLKPVLPALEGLQEFMQLAIRNNQPSQIARQEIELARLKIREAQRNLLPAIKLVGYNTDGEVSKVEYEEREIKAQLDHPIFYGGRLRNSLSQARVNLEITERNYDRLRVDVAHKTEVSYYNLIASRMNLKAQQAIRKEARQILFIVQRQFEADLVIPLEMASAQSWYEQINFQIDSTKQDMKMAELTFMQVLNVAKPPEISPQKLGIKKFDIDLDECLGVGLKNRPEIYLSELLVKFNQYGRKIERSKNNFTVDLTTSLGHYQGAYKTEPIEDSDNWYIGIKATKPWGTSTTTTSLTSEETQPRFGQTSPTKAYTLSAEINLLDNLALLSDNKKAEIELQRAISDLNETSKTINFEIKDAYLNYQKALLQATTTQSETEFRRHQVNILKIRAQAGETGFASVIEGLVSLSRAQASYTQALANYFISLANIKQATGYGI